MVIKAGMISFSNFFCVLFGRFYVFVVDVYRLYDLLLFTCKVIQDERCHSLLFFHSVEYALRYSFHIVVNIVYFLGLLILEGLLLSTYVHVELVLLVPLIFERVNLFDYIFVELWMFIFHL